jgi:ABC-type amino acid transport substrate-binding protein
MSKLLFIILPFFICPLSANARLSEPIEFATYDIVPYVLHDDPEGRSGLFVDINEEISDRANVSHISNAMPIPRAMMNVEHGASDCLLSAISPWTREHFTPVASVIESMDAVIITRPGVIITKIEDLHGMRLAIPRGSFLNFPISTDPNIQRIFTNDYEQSVRLLKAARVDSIADSEFSIFSISPLRT